MSKYPSPLRAVCRICIKNCSPENWWTSESHVQNKFTVQLLQTALSNDGAALKMLAERGDIGTSSIAAVLTAVCRQSKSLLTVKPYSVSQNARPLLSSTQNPAMLNVYPLPIISLFDNFHLKASPSRLSHCSRLTHCQQVMHLTGVFSFQKSLPCTACH